MLETSTGDAVASVASEMPARAPRMMCGCVGGMNSVLGGKQWDGWSSGGGGDGKEGRRRMEVLIRGRVESSGRQRGA
jgi:hypothetical protein